MRRLIQFLVIYAALLLVGYLATLGYILLFP